MSKKRKGLSADEKRDVILSIYHTNKDVYNLKEIEQLGSKAGVVLQTIKDVNQSLVDDFLVNTDKIGSSNFYWSFPSQAHHAKKVNAEQLETQIKDISVRLEAMKKNLDEARSDRCSVGRDAKLERLAALKSKIKSMEAELDQNMTLDPVELKRLQDTTKVCQQSADRWTDNIWTIKKYLTKKRGLAGKEVDKLLGIDGSFDYLVSK